MYLLTYGIARRLFVAILVHCTVQQNKWLLLMLLRPQQSHSVGDGTWPQTAVITRAVFVKF